MSLQEAAPIAYAFLGGTLLDPYFAAVARSVALAAAERAGDAAGSADGDGTGNGDGGEGFYAHVLTRHVGMTALMLFSRAPLRERVRCTATAGTGVGLWRMGTRARWRRGLPSASLAKRRRTTRRPMVGDHRRRGAPGADGVERAAAEVGL